MLTSYLPVFRWVTFRFQPCGSRGSSYSGDRLCSMLMGFVVAWLAPLQDDTVVVSARVPDVVDIVPLVTLRLSGELEHGTSLYSTV